MARLGLLSAVALALCAAVLVHARMPVSPSTPHLFPSSAVRHLEPIRGFRVVHADMHLASPNVRTVDGHLRPYPDQITIEFSAFGEEHSYDLEIMSVFSPDTVMTVAGENGEESVPWTVSSYRKIFGDNNWVTATLREDGTMHAAINKDGSLLSIDPISVHERELHQSVFHQLSASAPHGMVAFRGEDMILDGENLHQCGEAVRPAKTSAPLANFTATARGSSRHLLAVDPWTDCRSPWVPMKLFTGVGADYGFFKAAGNTVSSVNSYISQLYSTMNTVYFTQLQVFLMVDASVINSAGGKGTYSWNEDRTSAACPSINALLDTFTAWRKTSKSTQQGLWHHFTDCYPPPGTVGLAWIGTICSVGYGAGVSSISSSMWLTVAHELGHNFGAQHTMQLGQGKTGSIMDYGDGKLNGEYQFHPTYSKSEMCTEIKESLSTSSRSGMVSYAACWTSYAPACGNSVVESGEECDDGGSSGCCDMSTCRWKAGSQCSTGECCSSCKYLPTTTTCGGGKGYCNNGACTQSFCSNYGMPFCGVQPTATCKQRCTVNGACNTMAGYTDSSTGKPLPVEIVDGATCGINPTATCQSAVCVTTQQTVTYSWKQGAWTSCSVTCGSGTQTSTVACVDSNSNVAADSNCVAANKPASSRTCSTGVTCVTYSWARSSFSTCTNDCGTGTQTASVTCVSSAGQTVANSNCASQTAPATQQSCNTQACPVAWSTSAWSNCNKQCGSGIQTRSNTCMQTQNGAQTATTASLCGTAPSTQQACNTPACAVYDWVAQNWGTCSKDCATGNQTRVVACFETTSNTPASSASQCTTTKPATFQVCNTQACPSYAWKSTSWSDCTVTCGGGTRTRLVVCFDSTANQQVAEEWCNMIKPAASETCNSQVCPSYSWVSSAWSTCTVTCGGGTSTRTNQCLDNNNAVVATSFCTGTAPATTQTCNIQACPTYSWYAGGWGTCSASCGGGSYTRTVECRLDGSVTAVASSNCAAASMPASSGSCNSFVCGTYTWSAGAWSDCSQACGGGQRYRVVNCVDQSGTTVGTARCSGTAPVTSEVCNSAACPVYWSAGQYGECSKPCGTGTKTRQVVCRQVSGDVVVDSSKCLGSPPGTAADCNPQLCPIWVPQAWGACSERCGDGIQNRTIPCIDYQGFQVPQSQCTANIPSQTQPCSNLPCPHWHHNDWLPCPVVCGGAIQNRTTNCRMPHDDPWLGRLAVDATLCVGYPDLTRKCNVDPCTPFYWGPITAWSECSATCGTGTQTTTIACIDASTGRAADSETRCVGEKPASVRSCNEWPCPIYEWHLLYGDVWNACSSTCGAGVQKRDVVCRNRVGLIAIVSFEIVDESFCADFAKPESTRICSGSSCGQHGFCQNAKCVCSGGYSGTYCGAGPQMSLLTTDASFYATGVPTGEQLTLRWTAIGDIATVSLLVTRASWKHPIYVARQVPNTGIYLWTVPSHLAAATDYSLITYYSPSVQNASTPFAVADPCNYLSCGEFGSCSAGRCVCTAGYTGTLCQLSPCAAAGCNSLHSTCEAATGVCTCTGGWLGTQCNTPPKCAGSCQNNGYQVQQVGAAEGVCSSCICPNSWTGATCGTCSLACQNGFKPDANCKKCDCGTASGFFGDKCECRYDIGSMKLLTSTSTEWAADTSVDGATWRFNETFTSDLALAVPGAKLSNFQVMTVKTVTGGVEVAFRIAEACAVTSNDEMPAAGRRLLAVSGDSPTIANMTSSIKSQLYNSDSQLMRGVATSSADASSFSTTSPSDSVVQPTQTPSGGSAASSNTLPIIIAVVAGVVVLLGVGVVCWCNSRANQAKRDNDLLKLDAGVSMTASAVSPTSAATSPQSTARLASSPVAASTSPAFDKSGLPPNWTEQRTDTGDLYFYNSVTGVSEWIRPTA